MMIQNRKYAADAVTRKAKRRAGATLLHFRRWIATLLGTNTMSLDVCRANE